MTRTAVLVTGASRGFGRCLALDFVREVPGGALDLHLWARNEQELHETERLAHEAWATRKQLDATAGALRTFAVAVDLSDRADYEPKIDAVVVQLQDATAASYSQIIVVHNAGSLGELAYTHEWRSNAAEMDAYWQLNVHSVLYFNQRFLQVFGATRDELATSSSSTKPSSLIINISSLCGIQPFATHGLYCITKAAREMHHAVIAKEQAAPHSNVRVLQYSPGPMDTGMQETIRTSLGVAPELVKQYSAMKANGTLIPPAASSRLGVRLALSGAFETGAHVDYYDIAPAAVAGAAE